MVKPVAVKALPHHRLWLRYADGVEGEVDLSEYVGKGVFELWEEQGAFEQVYIGEHGQVAWNDAIDLCPDALYLRLTGQAPEDVFPRVRGTRVDA